MNLLNALLFYIIILMNIFLIKSQRFTLFFISWICSSFKWNIISSIIASDFNAIIKSWTIKLMIWIKQNIKFCILFQMYSRRFKTFFQFIFQNFIIVNIINNNFKKLFSDFITIQKFYKFLYHISICIFYFKRNKFNELFLKLKWSINSIYQHFKINYFL